MPPWLAIALRRFKELVHERLGDRVHDVRLFGSWARGEATEDSDVDVFVLVDVVDDVARDAVFGGTTPVLLEHDVALSPTLMDEREWRSLQRRERRIAHDIAVEGIPV